ncbi:MAG: trmA [Proteobacteria bacterium]|nr:trmA [Pseudomonadota bacterium]
MPLQNIVPAEYASQLADKVAGFTAAFSPCRLPPPAVFASAPLHYRWRAEFRMLHERGRVDYAMFAAADPKTPVAIDDFPAVAVAIHDLMPRLRELLQASNTLKDGLYQVNFLATLSGEMLVTLIYHHPLGKRWEAAAQGLADELKVHLVGRSRGQKVVLGRDWLLEEFELNGRRLRYQQIEGSFTQPNAGLNRQMLDWAGRQAVGLGGDLLELYCGNGNFTVALAPLFERVLATEVNTASVNAAHYNLEANAISNVVVARLASEDISAALAGQPTRSKLPAIDFAAYRFSTLFVDPPRAGLDAQTLALAAGFENILYISCNPESLQENVAALLTTHEIAAAALFDQFPYTHHLESGLLLKRRPAN